MLVHLGELNLRKHHSVIFTNGVHDFVELLDEVLRVSRIALPTGVAHQREHIEEQLFCALKIGDDLIRHRLTWFERVFALKEQEYLFGIFQRGYCSSNQSGLVGTAFDLAFKNFDGGKIRGAELNDLAHWSFTSLLVRPLAVEKTTAYMNCNASY